MPVGPFAFQPSEFAKLVLVLVLARYYSAAPRVGWTQRVFLPGLIMAPGLLLMLRQPDLGSGLSYLAIYGGMLLVVGIRSKALDLILLFALMLFPFVWEVVWSSLHEYQRERVIAFVDPTYDTGGKGYHALQSRIAIGSGELMGKGLHGGTQSQLKFLPEGQPVTLHIQQEPQGRQGGDDGTASITHHRQRNSDNGKHAHRHPDIHHDWKRQHGNNADGKQGPGQIPCTGRNFHRQEKQANKQAQQHQDP